MSPSTTEPVLPQAPATAAPPSQPQQPAQVAGLDREQLMQLLQHIPGVMNKLVGSDGTLKADAAQTLSNLSQQSFPPPGAAAPGTLPAGITLPHGLAPPGTFPPGFPGEPGPNSHPRGPPNLGQLSAAVAMQAPPPPPGQQPPAGVGKPSDDDDGDLSDGKGKSDGSPNATPAPTSGAGRRGGRNGAAMGSDEWARMRKDNHKEVERRRRSNINEGINELGRIVPNGSGEKSKGAILSRAVQYIHHLKENEARNIEKWTLEKLLMDQAMGDLQAQLEEVKNMWTEERNGRQRVEAELETLKSGGAVPPPASAVPAENKSNGNKRLSEEGEQGKEDDAKRQRTE